MLGPRKRTLTAAIAILIIAGTALWWPSTNPNVIHLRVVVFGPGLVYGSLSCCYEDPHPPWDDVVAGVRAGAPAWLRVAVDLKPALDTHPGEEMANAVAGALEANPRLVVETLVPTYGADLVCGGEPSDEPIDAQRAAVRLKLLEPLAEPAAPLESCRSTLRRLITRGGAG